MNHTGQLVKVLHAVEDLKVGGMERVIASFVTGLDPTKFESHVVCLTRGGIVADELTRQGIPVTILGIDNYHRPGQILALGNWLRRGKYHILHTHGYFASVAARLAGIFVGIPCIVNHVHSTYTDYRKKHLLTEKALSFFTDEIICVSQAVREWVVAEEKIDREKAVVIYNGVRNRFVGPPEQAAGDTLRQELGIQPWDTVFTIISSLTPNKGHHALLGAFRIVFNEHREARLVIVGGGPMREELEAEARGLMIERNVIFTGQRNDIDPFLRVSDVCVLNSQYREGLGMALIEAMAAGLPVIGTEIGGIPELIRSGENGFLVAPGSVGALADAMVKLAKDGALRIRMGRRSRQIYEEMFTLSRMIQQIEALYERLLQKKSRAFFKS